MSCPVPGAESGPTGACACADYCGRSSCSRRRLLAEFLPSGAAGCITYYVRTRHRAGLDLTRVRSHGDVGDRRILLGLAPERCDVTDV